MTTKKNEAFKYLAGLLFLLSAVLLVADYIQTIQAGMIYFSMGKFSYETTMILDVIGRTVIAGAVLSEIPVLIPVGAGINLISLAMKSLPIGMLLNEIFWAVFWILIGISIVGKKYIKAICFTAGVINTANFVWVLIQSEIDFTNLSFMTVSTPLMILLLALGAVFLGMVLPEIMEKPKKEEVAAKQAQVGAESKLEEFEKLNGLLEKGYITKEEFNAKKEQIMRF